MKRITSNKEYRDSLARRKGFNNHKEYLDNLAKEKGFSNYKEYKEHGIREKGFNGRTDYQNYLARQRGFRNMQEEYISKKGFKTQKEYREYLFKKNTGYIYVNTITRLNDWARNRGFSNYKEYLEIITVGRGLNGTPNIVCDDRADRHFIGHIAEYGVSKIFKNIQPMFFTNRGYDFICEMGEKVEVKSSLLHSNNKFSFHIEYNDIADYIILIGFDNVLDLNPLYVWVVKKGEKLQEMIIKHGKTVQEVVINNLNILNIANNEKDLANFRKYEKEDELEKLKFVCKKYNKDSGMDNNTLTKAYFINILLGIKTDKSTDILRVLKEKQKKRRMANKIPIFPKEECNK